MDLSSLYTRLVLVDIFLIYSSCSGAYASLHSFPTRRSSDLQADRRWPWKIGPRRAQDRRDLRLDRHHRDLPPRSEEHTSELQSRQYLVCRLLLEKKKKYPF